MANFKWLIILSVLISVLALNCNRGNGNEGENLNEAELKETLITTNKKFVELENKRINSYIARHNYSMGQSGTGLRYQLYGEGEGEKAVESDIVTIAFSVQVLDGQPLVNADTLQFKIGKSDVPPGLNEGVQQLQAGQKARLILPAHLAYGLTGDGGNVPSNAALIYQIHLLKIEKNKAKK